VNRVQLPLALRAFVIATCVATTAFAQSTNAPPNSSLGSTHDGAINGGGAELPVSGPGYTWQTNRDNPGARFSTPRMIAALRRAAQSVAQLAPSSVVLVFDLSLQGGGAIPGHDSHTSGRDVDVGYYARDGHDAPLNLTEPVRFDASGEGADPVSGAPLRFDAGRTWAFMAAVLSDGNVTVQHIFIAPPLRALVLAAGRAAHAERALVTRAATLLHPPGNPRSAPHDDHFHIRIVCTRVEAGFGCHDGGGGV